MLVPIISLSSKNERTRVAAIFWKIQHGCATWPHRVEFTPFNSEHAECDLVTKYHRIGQSLLSIYWYIMKLTWDRLWDRTWSWWMLRRERRERRDRDYWRYRLDSMRIMGRQTCDGGGCPGASTGLVTVQCDNKRRWLNTSYFMPYNHNVFTSFSSFLGSSVNHYRVLAFILSVLWRGKSSRLTY